MAINTYPAVASPIKSVQRGSAAGAGTVTITAIDISKSTVNVFGSASSGTVSASFGMSMNAGAVTMPVLGGMERSNFGTYRFSAGSPTQLSGITLNGDINNAPHANISATVNAGNAVVNAGSNNLVSAVVQGYLSNSTSLVVSGACRWEVVEFN